ncbi:MAG: PDZ domain-containing protein [bacterium]|nr:PDZ domain-containing protein [bacterium]
MIRTLLASSILMLTTLVCFAQSTIQYEISFENAVHHEAEVEVVFSSLENKVLEVRMSRTSPGRYAVHEFAKNVYNVKAFDKNGNSLGITRPNPHQWNIGSHNGYVKITYTLYANRADGTYSAVDETHAHLNIPATFMFARGYEHRPIEVKFNVREDLKWKVATQLKSLGNNKFWAPDLHYFMDSPTQIADYDLREFKVNSGGKEYNIRFAYFHDGDSQELIDGYFERIKAIVLQEKAVYGELPDFDFGEYTFLASYANNVSGDGMEHRNSTILTDRYGLRNGGFDDNIGTVSHEFFHAWNVERIRPASLEPFDYEEANMSGELWFAEGFTSYYTRLILCRAGIISDQNYIERLSGAMNYVWNSPGRNFFNPIEMSYQAPFVDAAKSIDPQNKNNTFISYYSYGSVLGLALDLSLRMEGKNLDDYMALVWQTYGKEEIPYSVRDLQTLLADYAGKEFANNFFNNYVFDSKMPDYKTLFDFVGVSFDRANPEGVSFGARLGDENGRVVIRSNPLIGSSAYEAGLENGDAIMAVNGKSIGGSRAFYDLLNSAKVGGVIEVEYVRFGVQKKTKVTLKADQSYSIKRYEEAGLKVRNSILENRTSWLEEK